MQQHKAGTRKPGDPLQPVIINLPCTLFAVRSLSALGVLQQTAALLVFPRALVQLAQKSVALLQHEVCWCIEGLLCCLNSGCTVMVAMNGWSTWCCDGQRGAVTATVVL